MSEAMINRTRMILTQTGRPRMLNTCGFVMLLVGLGMIFFSGGLMVMAIPCALFSALGFGLCQQSGVLAQRQRQRQQLREQEDADGT